MMTISGYLQHLEINLVLEMFANTGQEVIKIMCGRAGLGFSSQEQVDVEEGFLPSCCSTSPIQVKSFDVKINVAICLEQGVTDC